MQDLSHTPAIQRIGGDHETNNIYDTVTIRQSIKSKLNLPRTVHAGLQSIVPLL